MSLDLTSSVKRLNAIYASIMNADGDLSHIDAKDFAIAWEGAKQFRDHSLLALAKHAYTALLNSREKTYDDIVKDRKSYEDVSKKLVNFTFRFLPTRQIALTFDLAATLIDSNVFESVAIECGLSSPYFSERSFMAMKLGMTGTSLFSPEMLVLPSAGNILKNRDQETGSNNTINQEVISKAIKMESEELSNKRLFPSVDALGADFLFQETKRAVEQERAIENQNKPIETISNSDNQSRPESKNTAINYGGYEDLMTPQKVSKADFIFEKIAAYAQHENNNESDIIDSEKKGN